ncbi:Fatty-acid amide hydrolase 2 [Armadillidium vulgare]|nr:Fatty-acid amide hydrolase 2 [Armadillidium vulgare]
MWARRDHVADEDAECVSLMKEAGAINLGVTNVPELCMWWESSNTIYGRTCCAYDANRIPGGSSGGEGSLQSACGTPLSIGSDIGGSIRLPSFFNGVFGHKPTSDVVSNKGAEPNLIGLHNSLSVTGPLCKYVDDLYLMYKVLAGKNLHVLSLDKKVDLKDIKIYYMENDGGNPILSRVNPEITFAQWKVLKHFEDEFKITPVKLIWGSIQEGEERRGILLMFQFCFTSGPVHFIFIYYFLSLLPLGYQLSDHGFCSTPNLL